MTYRADRHVFENVRPVLLAALACAALAACSTSDDTARVAGAIDTGTYPNLNVAPKAATEQFTTEERDAKLAALRAVGQQQSPAATGETEEARRKRLQLIGDDQSETLKVIESQ